MDISEPTISVVVHNPQGTVGVRITLMKNAVILHGTNGSSQHNWFPWLKTELEKLSYQVWVPDLPGANKPNVFTYNEFLLKNSNWQFDEETVLIGHSSGAVEILSLLQHLPSNTKIKAAYLVGAFNDNLGEEYLNDLFLEPFDFSIIKQRANQFFLIHSDNDPYCPLEQAQFLAEQLDGELVVKPGQAHFSLSTAGETYRQFPFLLELIKTSHD